MSKNLKEFMLKQTTGQVDLEFDDDSTQSYNMKDVVTAISDPVTGGVEFSAGGVRYTVGGSLPPQAPTRGEKWLSESLQHVHVSKRPGDRFPLGIGGQEQNVWASGGRIYNLFTGASLSLMSIPEDKDITASAVFYGSIAGTVLTVSEPTAEVSPDCFGPIQAGQTLQYGSGAKILPFGTSGTTGRGGSGTYALDASPGTANNTRLTSNFWTRPVTVIGAGAAGFAGNAAHSHVFREAGTLYCYWIAKDTVDGFIAQKTYVSYASESTPLAWTTQAAPVLGAQGQGTNGNTCVEKQLGTYYLYQECFYQDSFPVEGVTNSWQTIIATSSSPLGPFTPSVTPVKSLRPGVGGQVSGSYILWENGVAVNYFHGGAWGRACPSDIYRAVATDISKDEWVITNAKSPIATRRGVYETDQIADTAVLRLDNGVSYLFYSACNNLPVPNGFQLKVTPLLPTLMQYNGARWVEAQSDGDGSEWVNNDRITWEATVDARLTPPVEKSGTFSIAASSGSIGGFIYSGGVQNSYLHYDFSDWWPGTYDITLTYNTGPDKGIARLSLEDGARGFPVNPSPQSIDMYSLIPAYNVQSKVTVTILGDGSYRRRVQIKMVDKNASSSGYGIALAAVSVQRTSV